jgi:hypothetical protein
MVLRASRRIFPAKSQPTLLAVGICRRKLPRFSQLRSEWRRCLTSILFGALWIFAGRRGSYQSSSLFRRRGTFHISIKAAVLAFSTIESPHCFGYKRVSRHDLDIMGHPSLGWPNSQNPTKHLGSKSFTCAPHAVAGRQVGTINCYHIGTPSSSSA